MTFINLQPQHYPGEHCFACSLSTDKGGRLVLKGEGKRRFLGCSRYPDCKNTASGKFIKGSGRAPRYRRNRGFVGGGTKIIK